MMTRYSTAISCGSLITLGLFWLMTALISLHHGRPLPPRDRDTLDFLRLKQEQPLAPPQDYLFRELTEPVDLPPARPQSDSGDAVTGVRPLAAKVPTPGDAVPVLTAHHDGPLVAMVRVQPVYPERAKARSLDGYVVVQFDVTPDGTVTNVTVVESSHRVFEDAAIRAARKFRYKARVVDGVPLATRGVRNRFRFEMERT